MLPSYILILDNGTTVQSLNSYLQQMNIDGNIVTETLELSLLPLRKEFRQYVPHVVDAFDLELGVFR